MPDHDQHTVSGHGSQEANEAEACWNDLVTHRLPATLETQARAMGAFQRVRALPNAQTLLRALLCYVLGLCSLKQLSGWSRLVGLTSKPISAPAWHKRLQKASSWLLWLVGELLQVRLAAPQVPNAHRVLLVDATFLTQMGKTGDLWRVHAAYDLLAGTLAWLRVTDRSVGESLGHLPIQAGDILVADRAYSKAPQLAAVQAARGYSLTRFSPCHLPVFASQAPSNDEAFRMDVPGWLRGLLPGIHQRHGVIFAQGQSTAVRLIAVVFPHEQAEALRQHARRQARAKGRTFSDQSQFFAGFHLMVTTLPEATWPASLVVELYQARWQIEILFKRIKQVLDVHRLPCHCPQTAQALIAALLVGWLLIEEEARELRRQISDAEPLAMPLSGWQLDQWVFLSLQNVIRGWWSPQQLRALAPSLRPLFVQQRQRPLKEHQRRLRFHALLQDDAGLVSFFDCSSA